MHFRSVIFFLWPVLFLIPSGLAQKRVVATVNPNATALNGTADIYDPSTGKVTAVTGKMVTPREQNIAARLLDGKVIIAGGYNNRDLRSAELFDPSTQTFVTPMVDAYTEAKLTSARTGAAAVSLNSGNVIIMGGYNGGYLNTAEIYDASTQNFGFAANSMQSARQFFTASKLQNGNLLIAGGYNGSAFLSSAELFQTRTSKFVNTTGVMNDARANHTSTLLPDGKVLIAGGCNNAVSAIIKCDNYLNTAEIYDPDTDEFTATGSMLAPRAFHTATLLSDGRVLLVGGSDGTNPLTTAEIYDPATGEFSQTGGMAFARIYHTASLLPDGKVLIAGGQSADHLDSLEVYDPASGAFSTLPATLTVPRSMHSAVTLEDGRVMFIGGENTNLLYVDINYQSTEDNVSPTMLFSPDGKTGFVPYTGSGVIVAFSAETGQVLKKIATGGYPTFMVPLPDGRTLLVVSALDNKVFRVDMQDLELKDTYTFDGTFGFGSIPTLSPDGATVYVSSTATGAVIKFDASTGKELARLATLQAPAQITVTKDGKTLIVVDVTATELVFVDAATMAEKYRMSPLKADTNNDGILDFPSANFTIYNKAVLNQDETQGVIGSQDSGTSSTICLSNTAFVFDPSDGKILQSPSIGCTPAFTALLPTNTFWAFLGQGNLSLIPTWRPDLSIVNSYSLGAPLKSANILVTPDAKYVYYTLSSSDLLVQQDVGTRAIVGAYLVGDYPNEFVDQASSLAITPDLKTMAVLNFASNEVDLLADSTMLRQTKQLSYLNDFTGLSVVNLSDKPTTLKITELQNSGVEWVESPDKGELPNPATVTLAPNAQYVGDIAALYNLNTDNNNQGRLTIESDQPAVAGFSMTGKLRSSFPGSYVGNMFAFPLQSDYRNSLHSFVIPEIPQDTDASVELNFVNPNYNVTSYEAYHYGTDGTELESKPYQSLNGSVRETKALSDFISTSQAGRVIVYGGYDAVSTKDSAYVFDYGSKNFSNAATLGSTPRQGHTATALQSKKILFTGGKNGSRILKSAEVYDPVTSSFLPTAGTMLQPRYRHTATRLASGQVLIAGGQNDYSINNTAELYDVNDDGHGTFKAVPGTMISAREAHTATLLNDGTVLLAGGLDGWGSANSAELYVPGGSFKATGSMSEARAFHTATKLPDGRVLITGGYNGNYLNSAEIYDPATGTFTPTSPMIGARSQHTATLLSNGTVLIAGGKDSSGPLATAEIYDPATATFTATEEKMAASRYGHTATLLNDDTDPTDGDNDHVVIIGGFGINDCYPDSEPPSTTTKHSTTDSCDTYDDYGINHALSSAEIYDPVTQTFTRTTGDMAEARQGHTATLLEESNQGYLRIESEIGLLFNEIYTNAAGTVKGSMYGLDIDKNIGVTTLYSPRFVISSSAITLVNIINGNQDYPAQITLRLHNQDGSVLATSQSWLLPINGQLKGNLWDLFGNPSSLYNKTGWVEVVSSVDQVVGTVTFKDANDVLYMTGAELSGIPMSRFVYPMVSEDAAYQTEVLLLNSGNQAANVVLELWGPSGTLDASAQVSLGSGGQLTGHLIDFFPNMEYHSTGNVRIRSDQPLHSLALISARDSKFVSAEPPVAYPGSN